jgi:integrase
MGSVGNGQNGQMCFDEAVDFYKWGDLARSTQQRRYSCLKKFGLLGERAVKDLPTLSGNHNTRLIDARILNQTFGTDFYIPQGQRRVYELPNPNDIALASYGKHGIYVMLMAFAGLRLGEACACDASWLKGNKLIVKASMERDIRKTRSPKTGGSVRLPDWLVEEIKKATFTYPLPKSLYKWMKRRDVSPHQLRHYFATQLFSKTNNLEAIRRQMRHSNIKTTLTYYLEVSADAEEGLLPERPIPMLK